MISCIKKIHNIPINIYFIRGARIGNFYFKTNNSRLITTI